MKIQINVSRVFKITLATISLFIGANMTMGAMFLSWFSNSFQYQILIFTGPATLALYIAFLKTRKDLFFLLSLAPLIIWFVAVFIFKLN